MEHVPVDRQIALFKLLRKRRELLQLGVEIGQHKVDHRLAGGLWQRGGYGIQLLNGGARRRRFDSRHNQAVHFSQLARVRHVVAEATVDILQMA